MSRQRFIALCLVSAWPLAQACKTGVGPSGTVKDAVAPAPSSGPSLEFYEATRIQSLSASKACASFKPEQGFTVTKRDTQGQALEGKVRVLADNPNDQIYIVGDFNRWGADKTAGDQLTLVPGTPYFEGSVRNLKHGMAYRLEVNGVQVLDPAATLFSSADTQYLNSVFWDFGRPSAYKMTKPLVDLRTKPLVIAESEVYELARKWPFNGSKGPTKRSDTYKFIAQSGLIDELQKSGYNAVEFLPFNTSMDGEHWHFRYQVYGLFAPESRYGDPDDFARMIDAFNKSDIAVIMDAVVGHYPITGNAGVRDLAPIGLHQWKKADGKPLYGSENSPWQTKRYDYANPYIRKFLTDSITHMVCQYGLSGIRFDNLDGIRLYEGPGGGGPEFLKELMATLRDYRPEMMLIAEMFYGESAVLQRMDQGGFGVNYRTHSDFFDFLKDNMLEPTEKIDLGRLRTVLRGPWDWREAPRVLYATNHDEAANRRNGATGSYLGSLLNGGGWYYVEKKTMAFGSLAMLASAAYLDMPQMRLLQEGSFNDRSAVDWDLKRLDSQKAVYSYFADLSVFVRDHAAFAFQNYGPDIENHVDAGEGRRVISLRREDKATGKVELIVINLGHVASTNYAVGVQGGGIFRIAIDSDSNKYGGGGELEKRLPSGILNADGPSQHGKDKSLSLPYLPAYGVVVLEKQ